MCRFAIKFGHAHHSPHHGGLGLVLDQVGYMLGIRRELQPLRCVEKSHQKEKRKGGQESVSFCKQQGNSWGENEQRQEVRRWRNRVATVGAPSGSHRSCQKAERDQDQKMI